MAFCYNCRTGRAWRHNQNDELQGLCAGCSNKLEASVRNIITMAKAHATPFDDTLPSPGDGGPMAYLEKMLDRQPQTDDQPKPNYNQDPPEDV